jgi:hypothetical protein
MQKNTSIPYGYISAFFVLILIVLAWGFHRTYTIYFPHFKGFKFAQHFHGAIMLLWMFILIAQPLLIRYNKVQIHRAIGKFTYILAPVLFVALFLVSRMVYLRTLSTGGTQAEAIGSMTNSIPDLIDFIVLYSLAVIYRKNTFRHMRFMICTSFLMIGPGLGRALFIYFKLPDIQVTQINTIVILSIGLFLWITDIVKGKWLSPYVAGILAILFMRLCYFNMYSSAWQSFGSFIARHLY